MILVMNGPGVPVLDFASGRRLAPPSQQVLYGIDMTVLVDPFSTLVPLQHTEEFYKWLPVPANNIVILAPKAQLNDLRSEFNDVRELPELNSISDVSKFQRIKPANFVERCVRVRNLQTAAIEDLRKRCAAKLVFMGTDVPRFEPGQPWYYLYSDDGLQQGVGPEYPEQSVDYVSAADTEALEARAFKSEPGSFRVRAVLAEKPEPCSILHSEVLKLSSDPDFADAAVEDFKQLSTMNVRSLCQVE